MGEGSVDTTDLGQVNTDNPLILRRHTVKEGKYLGYSHLRALWVGRSGSLGGGFSLPVAGSSSGVVLAAGSLVGACSV